MNQKFLPLEILFKKSTCYAGIGSRDTPESILSLIGSIAEVLTNHGLMLRSGGAPGAGFEILEENFRKT